MVDSVIESNGSTASAPGADWLRNRIWAGIWQTLRHPLWLLIVAAILLILQIAASLLPQMPGQFTDDAVERTRWLLSTQESYGSLSTLFAWLGLFDFTHSFVLRGLLALLTLLVFVQVGDLLSLVQRMHTLRRLIEHPTDRNAPIPVPGLQAIYRLRIALPESPSALAPALSAQIGQPAQTSLPAAPTSEDPEREPEVEQRWLILDRVPFLYLRLLLAMAMAGLFILVWGILSFGWEADPPPLAPDASFRLPSRDLWLSYQLTAADDDTVTEIESRTVPSAPALLVSVGEERGVLDVRSPGHLRLGNVDVWTTPANPALIVESWQADAPTPALTLPGQSGERERFSFAFPSVGSEESVLIPAAELGVRLVRLPEANRFLVEVVSSGAEIETQRTVINADDAIVLPYPDGELVLRFRYLPSVQVSVQSTPADWLIMPLLFLAVIGAVGLLRRPRFLLCQLAAWPPDRSVLVAQSDDPSMTAALTTWGEAHRLSTKDEAEHGE